MKVLKLGVIALVFVRLAAAAEIPRPDLPKPQIAPPALPPMVAPSTAPPPAALVPLKDFVRKPEFQLAKISPNGEYLAVTVPVGASTGMTIIDLKQNKLTAATAFSHGEHVYNFWWVSPNRIVLQNANRGGPLDQPRLTGEFYGMNADGSQKNYLFGYRGSAQIGSNMSRNNKHYAWGWMVDPLPRDPQNAMILIEDWERSQDMRNVKVSRMNVYNGELHDVGVLPGRPPYDLSVDESGKMRFAYTSDENGKPELMEATDTSAGWKDVALPGGAPEAIDLYASRPDGSATFMRSEDAQGRECLRELHPGGEVVDLLCQDGPFGTPVFSLDGNKVIAIGNGDGVPDTKWIAKDDPDAKFLQALQRSFKGQRIRVTSRTLDSKLFVLLVESGNNPGDFYLVNRDTKKAQYLISRRRWIDPAAMTPVEAIEYKTRDGATIHGYLTSRQPKDGTAPLVLMPHGGPHGVHDAWDWDPWAQALASRGYAVLQVNYRGSGGYGEAFERAGYRKWGTLMQDDLTDAVRWAIENKLADKGRICIAGASYGGYAALMSSVREPDLYRCAVSMAGVYDLVMQASDSDTADFYLGQKYLERVLGDEKSQREQSPLTYIDKLKVPVLIAHGTADRRVPFSQAKALRAALDKLHKPYEWAEYPDEEHGFWDDANHEDFLARMLAFLDKNIGAGAK